MRKGKSGDGNVPVENGKLRLSSEPSAAPCGNKYQMKMVIALKLNHRASRTGSKTGEGVWY